MILYGADDDVSQWVAQNLFNSGKDYFGECPYSIGQIIDGELGSGVVYNNYRRRPDKSPLSIEMTIFTTLKRWANRPYLKAIFSYPFIQLSLERVQITTSVNNDQINSVVSRLGFTQEGRHRKAHFDGGDCFSWSMLKSECQWI